MTRRLHFVGEEAPLGSCAPHSVLFMEAPGPLILHVQGFWLNSGIESLTVFERPQEVSPVR